MYVCIDGLICSRQLMGVHTFLNPNVALNMVLRLASYWIHYTLKWQIHRPVGKIWCHVLLLQKASIARLLKKCRNLSPVLKKVWKMLGQVLVKTGFHLGRYNGADTMRLWELHWTLLTVVWHTFSYASFYLGTHSKCMLHPSTSPKYCDALTLFTSTT